MLNSTMGFSAIINDWFKLIALGLSIPAILLSLAGIVSRRKVLWTIGVVVMIMTNVLMLAFLFSSNTHFY